MSDTYSNDGIRVIVRGEIAAAPVLTKLRRNVDGLLEDVDNLKEGVNTLKDESLRHGVLLEDMDSKLDTALELLVDQSKLSSEVGDHKKRITKLEGSQEALSSTVKSHSQKLKTL